MDDAIAHDPAALVGVDVVAAPDEVVVFGELSSSFAPDYERVVRDELARLGCDEESYGLDPASCRVDVRVRRTSPDIARVVRRSAAEDAGSGDGGACVGFACDDTPELMPLPTALAHRLARRLDEHRAREGRGRVLSDGKAQVCVEYEDGTPVHVQSVVLCAQHSPDVDTEELRDELVETVVRPCMPRGLADDRTQVYVNPTGRFMTGGVRAKAGMSGRKTAVDLYGGASRTMASAIVGKDPTKANRSGAYMARYIAKNVVASGLARVCEAKIAYAIGLADPLCADFELSGLRPGADRGRLQRRLRHWVREHLDLRPAEEAKRLRLARPVYGRLACYGNVGANAAGMAWEATDLAEALAADLGRGSGRSCAADRVRQALSERGEPRAHPTTRPGPVPA